MLSYPIYLSIYICIMIYLSLYPSVCIYTYICPIILSIQQIDPICLPTYLSTDLSTYLSTYLPTHPSILSCPVLSYPILSYPILSIYHDLSIYISRYPSNIYPIILSIYSDRSTLFVYLPSYLPTFLLTYLSIYLSIHLCTASIFSTVSKCLHRASSPIGSLSIIIHRYVCLSLSIISICHYPALSIIIYHC